MPRRSPEFASRARSSAGRAAEPPEHGRACDGNGEGRAERRGERRPRTASPVFGPCRICGGMVRLFYAVGVQTRHLTPHWASCGRWCRGCFVPAGEDREGAHDVDCREHAAAEVAR